MLENIDIQDYNMQKGLKVNDVWYPVWRLSCRKIFKIPHQDGWVIVKIVGDSQCQKEFQTYQTIENIDKKYFPTIYGYGELTHTDSRSLNKSYKYIIMEYIAFKKFSYTSFAKIPAHIFKTLNYLCKKYNLIDVVDEFQCDGMENWTIGYDGNLYILDYGL
jgi:hypothetical protein